jgi:hypothetical protein
MSKALSVFINANNNCSGTIIDYVGGAPSAPIDIVRRLGKIHGFVPFVTRTGTAATAAFATAVIVGNDVVLIVPGVETGADPRDG